MNFRDYTPEQYDMITHWWEGHNWVPVPEIFLSKTGLIVEDEGVPRAVIWLYRTDSPVMMGEWLVTNPDNTDRQSYEAVKFLLTGVKLIAEGAEAYLMTFLQDPSLVKAFKKQGFTVEEKPYTIAHFGG